MKYFMQETKHNPPETYGDCVRTCIACLLDREPASVPNFFDPRVVSGADAWYTMEEWLADAGYMSVKQHVAGNPDALRVYMGAMNPNVLYMLMGSGHAVVCCGAEIIHDPSWLKLGVAEAEIIMFLLPASMRYVGEDDGNICPDCSGCGWENPAQALDKCQCCEGSGHIG